MVMEVYRLKAHQSKNNFTDNTLTHSFNQIHHFTRNKLPVGSSGITEQEQNGKKESNEYFGLKKKR